MESFKKDSEFIFVLPGNRWNKVYMNSFGELKKQKNVEFVDLYHDNGKIVSILRRVCYSRRLNRIKLFSPFIGIIKKWVEIKKFSFELLTIDRNTNYYIIFFNLAVPPVGAEKRLMKNKKTNMKYVLYSMDSWDSKSLDRAKAYHNAIHFDYFITFDYEDSIKYNIEYVTWPYCMLPDRKDKYTVSNDLIYVGLAKDRLRDLTDIFLVSESNNCRNYFSIADVDKEANNVPGIIYNKWIEYPEIVETVKESNCILEVLFNGQSAPTLRYFEAVCYNKKLLTNNKNVVNLPFYNPDYIHIFENTEDIDWDWVKERIPVDYHYDGRFSPKQFIKKIIELEEEKG